MRLSIVVLGLLTIGSMVGAEPWTCPHWPSHETDMVEVEGGEFALGAKVNYVCRTTTGLWGSRGERIYRFNSFGTIVAQWIVPDAQYRGSAADIAWDGSHLWIVDPRNKRVREFTAAGQEVGGWDIPPAFSARPTGLAWDGSHLWLTSMYNRYIGRFTTQGALVGSIAIVSDRNAYHTNWGMSIDGGGLSIALLGMRYRRPVQVWDYSLAGVRLQKLAVTRLPIWTPDKIHNVCGGTGVHDGEPCASCGGTGRISIWAENWQPPIADVYYGSGEYCVIRQQPDNHIYKLGPRPTREPHAL